MAIKMERISYQFLPIEKAAMIIVLDQFEIESIQEIKNELSVNGNIVLNSHQSVILARLVTPHYPMYANRLLAPVEFQPTYTPDEIQARYFELINR